jgi:hypothetical protein
LKVKCEEPLSNIAFNFNVRRYTKIFGGPGTTLESAGFRPAGRNLGFEVGRCCVLTVAKAVLKAPMVSALEVTK